MIYLYQDGMIRLSTTPYKIPDETNILNSFIHNTKYVIN
jgi:hypothetical protein